MQTRNAIIAIIVILIVIAGIVFFSNRNTVSNGSTATTTDEMDTTQMRITAKHQYKDGEHIIVGEAALPTPCDTLKTDTTSNTNATPEEVTVNFTTQNSGEACAQVVSSQQFKVTFDAQENAVIKATWNGSPAILNLIPADPNEDLSQVKIEVKG